MKDTGSTTLLHTFLSYALDRGTLQLQALAALCSRQRTGRRQSLYGGFAEKKNLLTSQVMSFCCFNCTVDQTPPGPYLTHSESCQQVFVSASARVLSEDEGKLLCRFDTSLSEFNRGHTVLSTVHCPLPTAHCPLSIVHCPLSIVHSPLSTVHCPLSTVHCPLSTVHCPLSTVHCPLSTVHCPLSTLHCPLSTVHCPLSTVHCPLSTVH